MAGGGWLFLKISETAVSEIFHEFEPYWQGLS